VYEARGLQRLAGLFNEVTRILSAVEQGDPHAAEQLLPLVYQELRRLAAEKMAQAWALNLRGTADGMSISGYH
jgi:hypothetical protein